VQQVGINYYTCNAAARKMSGIKLEKLKFRVQPHRIREAISLPNWIASFECYRYIHRVQNYGILCGL